MSEETSACSAELRKQIAMAICRVQLNGGDPDQWAVRWNGAAVEPQSFPAWRDYLDEANSVLAVLDLRLAHIAGLREAAQILSGYLKASNTAGLQTGLLQDSLDDILAHIAELEKPRHE